MVLPDVDQRILFGELAEGAKIGNRNLSDIEPTLFATAFISDDLEAARRPARKLLSRVWRSQLSPMQRLEAFFHLTPHFAYPLMVFLSVLLLPALNAIRAAQPPAMMKFARIAI